MKRYLTFAVMAIAMLLSVASCKKESVNEPELVAGPGEFIATIASNSIQNAPDFGGGKNSTKATINSSRQVIWQNNDAIKINGVTFTCGTVTTSEATFTKDVNSSETVSQPFNALYGCTVTGTGNSATYSIPASMTYDANNLANNLPLYAYSTDYYLTFHNLCAALKVTNIPSGTTTITVTANENLNGTFTVNDYNTESPYATISSNGNCTTTVSNITSGATEVYIPIPQGTYTDFTVTVYNGSTSLFSHTLAKISFMANKIYNAPCEEHLVRFTAREACVIGLQADNSSAPSVTLSWTKYSSSGAYQDNDTLAINPSSGTLTSTGNVTLAAGEYVEFHAPSGTTTNCFSNSYETQYVHFTTTSSSGNATVNISGNILYLLDYNGKTNAIGGGAAGAFGHAFEGVNVVDASELIIPALNSSGYIRDLFRNCTYLTNPPALPEYQEAKDRVLFYMFTGCTSLTSAPVLRCSTLRDYSYGGIFKDCTKIYDVTLLATSLTSMSLGNGTYNANQSIPGDDQGYWLDNAGTDPSVASKPHIVHVSNSITTLDSGAGEIIKVSTPTNWKIVTLNGDTLGSGTREITWGNNNGN